MAANRERTGIVTGVNAPEHHVHHHVVLLRAVSTQHALSPGGVLRQHLHLDFGLTDVGLNALEAAAVFVQLEQHQVIALCAAATAADRAAS